MLDEFVTLKANEPSVGDIAFKLAVLDDGLEFGVVFLEESLSAFWAKIAVVEVFVKISFGDLARVYEFEDDSVNK